MGNCITCDKWAKLQCGHFIRRQHTATRWNHLNAFGQCSYCNKWLHGNEAEYYRILVKGYGQDVVDELMRLKRTTVKFSRDQLLEMIERYKT